jgi:hypothetical protein
MAIAQQFRSLKMGRLAETFAIPFGERSALGLVFHIRDIH